MTPGARVAAAIAVLDQILAGEPAEKALTAWARGSRFAGSKDRAAVRDHVFDVLRQKGSLSAGETLTGRALMLCLLKAQGQPVADLFSGEGYGPAVLSAVEKTWLSQKSIAAARADIPAWIWPAWADGLGATAESVAAVMQQRAALHLRLNPLRGTRAQAQASLLGDGVETTSHPQVAGCLIVTKNPRRVKTAAAYTAGLVEIQDAASQCAVARIPAGADARVLDYCAGGGGKALAIAARGHFAVTAHDISPARMADIAPRALRADVAIECCTTAQLSQRTPFDLVICDAPCSGSGTWRRTPDAKWRLDREKLLSYNDLQSKVLAESLALCRPGGHVAYMTCSVLRSENRDRVDAVIARNPAVSIVDEMQLVPGDLWDGFYLCVLQNGDSNL